MNSIRYFIGIAAFLIVATVFASPDREAVVQRVRAELAAILKKEPSTLTVDKPIVGFGADELDVVEWVMAVEEAFRVEIKEEEIVDVKTRTTRKDLSIATMSSLVLKKLPDQKRE